MKSVTKLANMSMLVAACLSCGCGRNTPEKTYTPKVGKDTLAVAVTDYSHMFQDPSFRAFQELASRKCREIGEAVQDEKAKELSAKLEKYYKMSQDDYIREFYGVEPTDLKWSVWAIDKFDPDEVVKDAPKNVKAPHCYAVLYSARKIDLDKVVDAYRGLFQTMCDADSDFKDAVAEMTEALTNVVSYERVELDGVPAYRFTLTDDDTGEKIGGISPLVTTINDGKMVVFAISDPTLAYVKGLYDGSEPAAAEDSAIGRELALPENLLGRLAIVGIDEFAKVCKGDDGDGEDEEDDDDFEPDDLSCARFDLGFDTAKNSLFMRAAADFVKADQAAALAKEAEEGIGGFKMVAALMLSSQKAFTWCAPILQTLEIANSGNTLAAGLSIPYSAVESIDAAKMAEAILEAQKGASSLPLGAFGGADDDDDDDDDDEE